MGTKAHLTPAGGMEEQNAAGAETPLAPPEKKRGRGRPKKQAPKEMALSSTSTVELAMRDDGQAQLVMPAPVRHGLSSSNLVTEMLHNIQLHDLEQTQRKAPAPSRKVILDTEAIKLKAKEGFTEFDRAVLEAIFAQLTAGNKVMTPAMIFRSMTSKEPGVNVSTEMLEEINKSVEKCMYGKVVIPAYSQKAKKQVNFDSNILTFVRAEFRISGNLAQAYEIQAIPLLYKYCKENGALIYSPIEMNAIEGLAMTKRSVAIMNYLQRLVVPHVYNADGECMKVPDCYKLQEDEPIRGGAWLPAEYVTYEELYDAVAGLDGSSKRTRWLTDKTRETVGKILDCWAKAGYILRWESVKQGRSILGVRIYFYPVMKKYLPMLEGPTEKN